MPRIAGDDGCSVGDGGAEQRILTALGIVDGHGGNANGICTCDVDQRGEGVGDVIAAGGVVAPMLVKGAPAVDAFLIIGVERVIVFALGKEQIAQRAAAEDAAQS